MTIFFSGKGVSVTGEFLQLTKKTPVNPNRTELFLTCLGWGGWMPPPIIFVVCGPIRTKLCIGIDNQSISLHVEKNWYKINDVIDNDVIIVRKLAEKTVKRI